MHFHYLFKIKTESSLNKALEECSSLGLIDLYTLEDTEKAEYQIGGFGEQDLVSDFLHLELEQKDTSPTISWEDQSAQFSPYFQNGFLEIPLRNFSTKDSVLRLLPGPGFGDLSHPTTHLVLSMMEPYVVEATVVDIGCGSGILSFAASLMGASRVIGLDIEPSALVHAEQNKNLNNLTNPVLFAETLSEEFFANSPAVLLMNMTFLEQKTAWKSLAPFARYFSKILTSGILAEQIDNYLIWAEENDWMIEKVTEKDGWLGFVFKTKKAAVA